MSGSLVGRIDRPGSALLLSVIVVVAGCTGSGGTASSGTSKASFIRQADRYCTTFQQQYNGLIARFGDLPLESPSAYPNRRVLRKWARFLHQDLADLRAELGHLKALPEPSQDQGVLRTFLGALESAIRYGQAAESAALAGDQTQLNAHLQAGLAEFDREGSAAKAYGFHACGQF